MISMLSPGLAVSWQQRTVHNQFSLKQLETAVALRQLSPELLRWRYQDLCDLGVTVIGCHKTRFYDWVDGPKVRAVWSDRRLDPAFLARDLMTSDLKPYWKSLYPADHPLSKVMADPAIPVRRRASILVRNHRASVDYLDPAQRSNFDHTWHRFEIDALWTSDFADHVADLAARLGLSADQRWMREQHQRWLMLNPRGDFGVKSAIRHVENRIQDWCH